jgi:hypothetical protein
MRKVGPVLAEPQEAQFVPLEGAETEAQGMQRAGEAPDAEDEVELAGESFDDSALIEESEQEDDDVTEIIGGDIDTEIEKGT